MRTNVISQRLACFERHWLGYIVLASACLFAAPPGARAQQTSFTFDPSATTIEFTLAATLHTVHGTMHLQRGEIQFDPSTGTASGEVVVDATSAGTGNKSRDRKMHSEVLRSAQYPEIIFTPEHVTGTIEPAGTSALQVAGTFEMDGRAHPMTIPVTITRDGAGGGARAQARFAIPYVEWGLKNPSTLFLRVSERVQMEIDAVGKLDTAVR